MGLSFGICLLLAIAGGVVFAVLADRVLGIIVLGMGLLGATEPPEGWATKKDAQGRRSVAARAASELPEVEGVSSLALVVWAVAVGGALIALSLLAFSLAA
jgi:hypothetical protein